MSEATSNRMSHESVRAARDVDVIGKVLADRIASHGLERNVLELQLRGYTVVPALLSPEAVRGLRESVLRAAALDASDGRKRFGFGPNTRVLYNAVSAVPGLPALLLHPTLMTLLTYLLGDGYTANLITASIFEQGCLAGPVHSDNEFHPEPFPSRASVATGIWICDEFTPENGATHVVPRSHLLCRHPRPGEGEAEAIPIVAPPGSLILWNGATWHASGARTAPGNRVVLHTSFCRMHIRSLMSFADVPRTLLDQHPPELARMLGYDSALGFGATGPDAKAMARAKTRVNSQLPWS